MPDPEEFRDVSNQSIWALVKQIVAIADVLKKELPFDSLTPSWHVEDGTDEFTVGILARREDSHHCIMIYTHHLDEQPEPKEMYPSACCAVGRFKFFPQRHRHEKCWWFAQLRKAGWSITTANGFRCPLPTSHF